MVFVSQEKPAKTAKTGPIWEICWFLADLWRGSRCLRWPRLSWDARCSAGFQGSEGSAASLMDCRKSSQKIVAGLNLKVYFCSWISFLPYMIYIYIYAPHLQANRIRSHFFQVQTVLNGRVVGSFQALNGGIYYCPLSYLVSQPRWTVDSEFYTSGGISEYHPKMWRNVVLPSY